MNKRMLNKLRAQAGETIAEVLIAMFISVLGVAMLVGMIGASTRIIENSNRVMQKEYSKTVISTSADGSVSVYSVNASGSATGSVITSFSVKNQIYSSGESAVFYTPPKTS